MNNSLVQLSNKFRTRLGLNNRKAILGDSQGNMGTMAMLTLNQYFVRYLTSDGYSYQSIANGPFRADVTLKPNHAVTITLDPASGQYYIDGTDSATVLAGGGNPAPLPQASPVANGPYINQMQLSTLLVSQTPTASLKVMVNDWIAISGTTATYFSGKPDVDLSGLVPGSDHCIILVAIKSDFATIEAFASASIPLTDPLSIADVNNALAQMSMGSTPIWTYAVATGATQIFDTDTFLDCRQLVNIAGAGGGGGTVTSVALSLPSDLLTVSGSPVTSSGTLTGSKASQAANKAYITPNGSSGVPTFRSLVPADYPVFVASGASHAVGAVPDPGGSAGSTKFLREDATWAVPSGGGGGSSITKTTKSYYQRTVLYDNTLSGSGTWDVSGIDQTYDHLELLLFWRGTQAAQEFTAILSLNNDTTDANYLRIDTSNGSAAAAADRRIAFGPASTAPANSFGQACIDILNYTAANYKTADMLGSSFESASSSTSNQEVDRVAVQWQNTSAINRIALAPASGSFATGSRFQIVGVKAETVVTDVSGTGTVSATQNTTATVSNTSSETSLMGTVTGSMTYAANALNSVGRMGRFHQGGKLSSLALTPGNITVQFKLGSTAIVSSGAVALLAALSNADYELDVWWVTQSTGSSGTVYAKGVLRIVSALAYTVEPLNSVSQPVTIDLTGSLLADPRITFSVANASNSIVSEVAIQEVLN